MVFHGKLLPLPHFSTLRVFLIVNQCVHICVCVSSFSLTKVSSSLCAKENGISRVEAVLPKDRGISRVEAMCEPQDLQDRSDEVEALEAIFSEDFRRIDADSFEIRVNPDLFIRICFPETYPSKCSPLHELHGYQLSNEQAKICFQCNSCARANRIMFCVDSS
jgi:hypothetical protein